VGRIIRGKLVGWTEASVQRGPAEMEEQKLLLYGISYFFLLAERSIIYSMVTPWLLHVCVCVCVV
jgi:hypothetical protein